MALIGNRTVFAKHPGRDLGGSSAAGAYVAKVRNVKPGALRGMYTGGISTMTGVPLGCRPPQSWIIPQVAGFLVSRGVTNGAGALSASGSRGVNGSVSMTGSGSLTATGSLIASASASLAGSGAITSAGIKAVLNAAAHLAGSGNVSAAVRALGYMAAEMDGVGSVDATLTATGRLEATLTPFTELSPQSLAAAVWETEQGRFLYAVARNKVVTDPAAGTYTVYDEDGVTVLYTADLWADAAGTTPYSGSGAERRDRLT